MDTGWYQLSGGRLCVVPVTESVQVDLSVSRSFRRFTNDKCPSRTWALVKCGCTHAVSYWWALACTNMFYVFFLCCLCHVLSTSDEWIRLRVSPSQTHNGNLFYTMFKLWILNQQHWHSTYQAKHYDHMSKHCVLYISWSISIQTIHLVWCFCRPSQNGKDSVKTHLHFGFSNS